LMVTTTGSPMLLAACALLASAALAAHSMGASSSQLYAPQAVRTTQGVSGVLRNQPSQLQYTRVEAQAEPASPGIASNMSHSASQPKTKLLSLGALALAVIAFAVSVLKRRTPQAETWALATTGGTLVNEDGFEMQREGIKKAAKDSILTPRFYTTDFEECARILSTDINPGLNLRELEAMREEFVKDYNQNHFIRNDKFKPAAAAVQGESRKIFVEFLERSCTAEFSGFLLYKELGRRLKTVNPVIADIFTLMSRDEARHAGFLNKTMSDFNLALDLGFLTKHREYTFFQPKFILYATYLSEKIGYWRYISIYRHLQRNPDNQFSPLFQYFENWCQDENRHGDFLAAILKVQPDMLKGWDTKLWCRFFCHTVYITMYLNDHQRSKFYEQCGLNTTQFNQHVIRETNATTARIFPAVPNVLAPDYFPKMDKLVELNGKVIEIGQSDAPDLLKGLQRAPIVAQMAAIMLELFWEAPIEGGSMDIEPQLAQFV